MYVIMKTPKVCVQCQFMFGGGGKDTRMCVATPVLFVCVHGCAGLCVSVCVPLCSMGLSMHAVLDYAGYLPETNKFYVQASETFDPQG